MCVCVCVCLYCISALFWSGALAGAVFWLVALAGAVSQAAVGLLSVKTLLLLDVILGGERV